MTSKLDDVMAACMARTEKNRADAAKRMGVDIDDLDAKMAEDDRFDAAEEAVRGSGASLTAREVRMVARGPLKESEALYVVRRWMSAKEIERPILVLCGDVGVGKTMACAWAISEHGSGKVVHAPTLGRRVLPTRSDRENGFERINLKSSMLVLDDLGTEPSSDEHRWNEAFAMLIEARMSTGRTIITANMKRKDFASRYDKRIISRLNASSYVMELKKTMPMRATGGGL
mgnify:CR=1 FL=1